MKAVVLNAEWAPRESARISDSDAARKWAFNASTAYRNPSASFSDISDPGDPGPNEVILSVGACGICGSDVHMFETDDDGFMLLPYHLRAPVVIGHEFSGKVVALGSDVRELRVGELVAVEEIQWCGRCRECRGGYWNQCRNIEDLGFTLDGGMAEFVKVDARFCWSLDPVVERYGSEETALEVGALTEPTSVAYEGMFTRAGGFKPGGTVAVFGAGPIGLASVALARAAGAAHVFCVDPIESRRKLAAGLGASETLDPRSSDVEDSILTATRGAGAAMVVEASGNFRAVFPAIEEVLGIGGKIVVAGMDARSVELNFIRHQVKAASTYGTVGHSGSWDFPNVIALMGSGRIEMEKAITKRYALESLVDAVDETKNRGDGKVLVKPHLS
jgi:threonine dehydrogenase-like Zn-dependent dehydrogenase